MTRSLAPSTRHVSRTAWRRTVDEESVRIVPEETPVALTCDGSTYAVMMATPEDLEDFAIGFSLSEGVIEAPEEIRSLDIVVVGAGIEARMWLAPDAGRSLAARRRLMTGPTGCGLCGIESLEQAVMPPPHVGGGFRLLAADLVTAMRSLAPRQRLNIETRAVHAAAFWEPRRGVVALREDVGRHNALDKVVGALARTNREADGGMILLTSRVSVEMVQKTARLGAPVLAAVSAPTALALRMADAAGITLVAIAREDGFEIFTHPERIEQGRRDMSPERLVIMANQIGKFFAAQRDADAPAAIADHLVKFWNPPMRAAIVAHLVQGGAGLDPLVSEAVRRLRSPAAN